MRNSAQKGLPVRQRPGLEFTSLTPLYAHVRSGKMSRFAFYFIFLFLLYKSPSLMLFLCFATYVYIHYRTR